MKKTQHDYDAIIVGSGAGGGIAAYVLTQRGLRVLLLEAGRNYDPISETPMFQAGEDAPLNGAATPDKEIGFYDATVDGGTSIAGEPYTVAEGTRYRWWRARMLGGRTNHWGRQSYRYGPYDFRTQSRDGLGVDWPLSYEELAPYYDRVERLIGVFGAEDGVENSPDSSPGVLLPPPAPRAYEVWARMALAKRMGLHMVPNHAAILTRPLNGRQACVYSTDCHRGCSLRANFQTPTVLIPPALATGRLDIRTHAMVYAVELNRRGSASGVSYIDKVTSTHHSVRARAVVLSASTGETARILLNSSSPGRPNGLANSSGQVGRNLTDTVVVFATGNIPTLQDLPPANDDGATSPHLYLPWWGFRDKEAGRLKFATEYQVRPFGGRHMPEVEDFTDLPTVGDKPLYGLALRKRLRDEFGSKLTMGSCGGMIPNDNCRCEIDPKVKDRWGIPVLRFHWKWGEQELAQAEHAASTMSDMISAMGGGKPTVTANTQGTLMSGHESGTTRMGSTAANSVLNSFGQAWDVRNLYVADGASFAGQACKNPTETIMALAWRASDHLADSFARKDI